MVRSLSYVRSGDDMPQIQANANNINKGKSLNPQLRVRHIILIPYFISVDSLDCGITAIRCCQTPGCQKMGTTKSFLTILIFVGLLQGAIEMYFFLSVKQAAIQHSYNTTLVGM